MTRLEGMELLMPFINKLTQKDCLQNFVKYTFARVADGFFEKPASSTGKHHPDFAQGDGGLVRHTVKAAEVWDDLWRAYSHKFNDSEVTYSMGLTAVLLHDTCKYDRDFSSEYTLSSHDLAGADFVYEMYTQYFDDQPSDEVRDIIYIGISYAISAHQGRWSTINEPTSLFDNLVFLADYIASRKYVRLGVD